MNEQLIDDLKKKTIELNSFQQADISDLICPIVAIYINPVDYPTAAVARLFDLEHPTNVILIRNTIEELREDIIASFPSMVRFDRAKNDALSTTETWI